MWRTNAVLYGAIGILLALFGRELDWARVELPKYLEGRIGSPLERRLYRDAKRLIESGRPAEARPLLERSLRIDPYGEAGYWLGRAWLSQGDDEQALAALTRYLEIDPTLLDAHLQVARILERTGRAEQARHVLRAGLDFFREAEVDAFPRYDPDVERHYNRKAARVHERYAAAARTLERELGRLEAESVDPTARPR
jgi:tetratricopeptide (TPR) repeat protein